jgi:hypothetical protein
VDHFAAVDRLFGERLGGEELDALEELLGRLTDVDEEECEPGS